MTSRPQPGSAACAEPTGFLGLLAATAVAILLAAPARAQEPAPATAQAPFDFARTPGRLPKDIVPVEYVLHLVPDPAAKVFSGRMTVALDVRRPTAAIVMNALDIEVESAHLRGRRLPLLALAPVVDHERQTVAFALPAPLAPGRYALTMTWRGRINVAVEGLYAARYRATDGAERILLATDLEPTGARRILPCWDEPSFRARFRLSVDLPAGDAAYSNMPVERSETLADGRRRVAFAATPKMATYLLALVAGDLERNAKTVDGTDIGIVTTRGKRPLTPYPLAASGDLLHYYKGYFGTRYPLPKLDQIAIPAGFFGGMENWGAIVYNEATLLVDPKASAESARQRSFGIAAHEMAHQWFGNLVTMAWWDDLWLNEAFANWIAYKATDRLQPQWRVRLRAKSSEERAMALDARASTHPIRQPVTRDSEAESAFDEITYDKGSGFLRMLEAYLGEAAFRDGVQAYLRRHRYSNSTGADLWAALTRASAKPVAAIATSWTAQPGFPLVDVDARCDGGLHIVRLQQQRFRVPRYPGEARGSDDDSDRLWTIPIHLDTLGADAGVVTLLRDRSASTTLADGCRGALIVDRDGVGFFRVRYAPALFDALVEHWSDLPDTARLKLLADTSALVRADQLALARYLELVPRLADEPRLALWDQFLRDLEIFDELSEGEPARAALNRFARGVIGPRFAELGWDEQASESSEQQQLRGHLARALAHYGDEAAIAEGRRRFARYVATPASVAPSLVDDVVAIAGRHADAATYEALAALARRATTDEDRFRAYRAMASAQDPELAARTVRLATDAEVPQIIRHQTLATVARSGHLGIAWDYARQHVDALLADMKLYDSGAFFGHIVDSSAGSARADELAAFARERLGDDALVDVRRSEDEIRARAALKARLLPQLEAALAAR